MVLELKELKSSLAGLYTHTHTHTHTHSLSLYIYIYIYMSYPRDDRVWSVLYFCFAGGTRISLLSSYPPYLPLPLSLSIFIYIYIYVTLCFSTHHPRHSACGIFGLLLSHCWSGILFSTPLALCFINVWWCCCPHLCSFSFIGQGITDFCRSYFREDSAEHRCIDSSARARQVSSHGSLGRRCSCSWILKYICYIPKPREP